MGGLNGFECGDCGERRDGDCNGNGPGGIE